MNNREAFDLNQLKVDTLTYLTVQLLHTYPWWLPRKWRLTWARRDAIMLLKSAAKSFQANSQH